MNQVERSEGQAAGAVPNAKEGEGWPAGTPGSAAREPAGGVPQPGRTAHRRPAGGADVLEVAPGPGYPQPIELARLGFHVCGLDISRSFVEIASQNAREAAVGVDFRQGDAASLPFQAASSTWSSCRPPSKNFARPAPSTSCTESCAAVGRR